MGGAVDIEVIDGFGRRYKSGGLVRAGRKIADARIGD